MLVVSIAALVVSRGVWLMGLWLRAQERRDRIRLWYLQLVAVLPPDRELIEVHPDGTSLRITHAGAAVGVGAGRRPRLIAIRPSSAPRHLGPPPTSPARCGTLVESSWRGSRSFTGPRPLRWWRSCCTWVAHWPMPPTLPKQR
jgi:hypothetical protein